MAISHRVVRPTGPEHSDLMFIGEGPGIEEDRRGIPFCGKSGKVLWAMAQDYIGPWVRRDSVRVENLMDRRHTDAKGKDRGPTEEEFAVYAPLLRKRVLAARPKLIVTLGRYSTRAILRQDLPMEVANGCLYAGVVIPVVHPAAGLHQPEMLAATEQGLKAVGAFVRWLKGSNVVREVAKQNGWKDGSGTAPNESYGILQPRDAYPLPKYSNHIHSPKLFRGPTLGPELAIDTEYDPVTREPWCLTYSTIEGQARMVRADDLVTLAMLARELEIQRPTVILHYALADLEPLRKMGIDLIAMGLKIRDTGLEAFATQRHPKGLKPLAQRLAGMEMRDYSEVVGPVEERFIRDYLQAAYSNPEAAWVTGQGRKHSVVRRIEGMLWPVVRANSTETPKTLREKWADTDNYGEVRVAIESKLGPAPRPGLDDMPKEFLHYACRDADATVRVAKPLHRQVQTDGLERVVAVDLGPVPLLDRMQQVGMLVDVLALDKLRADITKELARVRVKIQIDTGIDNPGSGDQVAEWAAQVGLGLDKRTKGGKRIKVDENELQLVRFKHPSVEDILTYRELDKIRGTYVEPMYKFLVGTGRYRRLHPTFRLTSAVTGRIAIGGETSIPLMGVPVRTAWGKRVRDVFVAGPGRVIGSCDLSQIELRVGAGLSQDANMIAAFKAGVDLHTRTAAKFFLHDDSPAGMAAVTPVQRKVIKVPNFGILFGAREHRMEAEFLRAGIKGYDLAACKDMIDWWFGEYSGVKTLIDSTIEQGARDGFVTTEAGRRRYLPALRFQRDEYPFNRLREEAERQGVNFPIQGTAQEFEKRGMKVVDDDVLPAVRAAGYYCEPLLQIHDELLMEVDEDGAELCGELMVDAMTRESPWRGVPLGASWNTAATWGDLK